MAPPGEVGVLRRRPRNPSTAQCAPPTARPGVLKGRSFRCMVAAGLAEAAVPGDSPATGLPCCVMRPGLARQPAARSAAVISLQCACLARRHSFDSSVASYTAPHKSVHPAPRFGAPSSLGRCAAGRRPASVPSLRLSLHLQLALRRRIVPGGPASEGIPVVAETLPCDRLRSVTSTWGRLPPSASAPNVVSGKRVHDVPLSVDM